MPRSLTIHNDTFDTVYIKVGADQQSLSVARTVATAIATIAGITAACVGITVPGLDVGVESIAFEATRAIAGSAFAATAAITVSRVVGDLRNKGYIELKPGQAYVYTRTLSLWKQCHCVRILQNNKEIVEQEMFMRPIFTGKFRSNRDYSIHNWSRKKSRWSIKSVSSISN